VNDESDDEKRHIDLVAKRQVFAGRSLIRRDERDDADDGPQGEKQAD